MTARSSWPALPVDAVLGDLARALDASPAAVLVAAPGAGKTTRVPLALLDAPWRADGRIIVMEPRRLAARAAADQMARLLGEETGGTVGYRVRLDSKVSARTRIEVVTEGVFTRMVLDDPSLPGVAAVLFDEFHERSLDGDLGLALALDAQAGLRPELRLLVMSATIDGARVARLMGGAPVIVSEGRAFPVETRHRPRPQGERVEDATVKAVLAALGSEHGSILVFLPGMAEIRRVADRLEAEIRASDVVIAPLYGALDRAEQDRAVRPAAPGRRKVVLATSIAETSLTIEGVRVVIDSGLARVPRNEPSTGLTRLETVRVSRASADQRRGRAGRLEPGVCVRLWEEAQTATLPAFGTPEILEADLAPLVLDCAVAGIADLSALAFLDVPPAPALAEARALLEGLGALDASGRPTAEGRALARLPLPPRLAHMLHRAAADGLGRLAAEIAVVLTERGLGGAATDLAHRVAGLRADRSPRAREAKRLGEGWARLAGASGEADADEAATGRVLALAYPDRIAKARAGRPGEFLLANGRGAALDAADALAKAPAIVAAEVTGTAQRGRILAGAAFDLGLLATGAYGPVVEETRIVPDLAAGRVRTLAVKAFGAIALTETPVAGGERATQALMRLLAETGIEALPLTKAHRQLLGRAAFLRRADPEGWPDLSPATLAATAGDWLGPYVPGATAVADIAPDAISAALDALLGPRARRVAAEAPSHYEAPTGSRVPIDYDAPAGPTIAIRVQELYGLTEHPAVAGGRVPLVLELLSPAHRPIQTTGDLPGFWKGSWAAVRTEMRGRYPRHVWPEEPWRALPTTRAKPRGT